MPYLLDNMTQGDIPQVAAIERQCFSMPWPTSAYRRELKTPETNRYIVVRYIPSAAAERLGLQEPTATSLTSLYHPEIHLNWQTTVDQASHGGRSLLSTLLPWFRTGNGAEHESSSPFPIVGYAGLWLMVDEAHVTTIGIHPDHRGQGAGELLFQGLVDIARQMRASRITLEVRVSNTGAQALYRKYGLEVAGLRKRYYSDNGEDAYIMWSEPLNSARFQERISELRSQLVERLRRSFRHPTPPSRHIDKSKLQ